MEGLADVFRKHYKKLSQGTNIEGRKQELIEERKAKRETLIKEKRNIASDMSPYTPRPKERPIERVEEVRPVEVPANKPHGLNKRLEQLAKWKADKARRIEMEKANRKPLFKVYHVTNDLGVKLEDVNRVIKGKEIPNLTKYKSKFAPDNHQFKAPAGIKPMNMQLKNSANNTHGKSEVKNKALAKTKNETATTSSIVTRSQAKKLQEKETHPKGTKKSAIESSKNSTKQRVQTTKAQETEPEVQIESTTTEEATSVSPLPPVYTSPFVTISRGKFNARKEFELRRSSIKPSTPVPPELTKVLTAHTSPQDGANYFLIRLESEIKRINEICEKWNECLRDPDLPEEAHPSINVAIGQSKLLIAKKFEQFRGLIMQCKTKKYQEKVITCEDLHGFWDMIYMQVENLDKRFSNLETLKQNGWSEMLPENKVPIKKTKAPGKNTKASSKKPVVASRLKDFLKTAREKKREQTNSDTGLVKTPLKQKQQRQNTPEKSAERRTSKRVSMLKSESDRRVSLSPGLMMMKVSQAIKQGDGYTPAKSILKVNGVKSTGKKSVLFQESSPKVLKRKTLFLKDDKENTPVRRSLRLESR